MAERERRLRASDQGRRADRVVAEMLDEAPYSKVRKLFRKGCVELEGRALEATARLPGVGLLKVDLAGGRARGKLLPNRKIRLRVLFEDEHLLACVKPPGLVMLPGPGHGSDTAVHGLLGMAPELGERFGEAQSYGLVQRLDKGTSGIFVVPRHQEAYAGLRQSFAERRVRKAYWALARGVLEADEGRIEARLKAPGWGEERSEVVEAGGKEAVTVWRVRERMPGHTELELDLQTGRTHQIRAHLAHLGHPVEGDRRYAEAPYRGPRPLLHARRLALAHPVTGEELCFEVDPPRDYRRALTRARRGG